MAMNDMGNTPPDTSNPQDDASDGGYTIEIEVAGDGTITVSSEDASTEDAESQGGSETTDEGSATPVGSIQEACQLAEQIFQNNGKMPGTDDPMAAAKAGYSKSAKAPQMAAPNPGAVFGE